MIRTLTISCLALCFAGSVRAGSATCYGELRGDTLVIGNALVERRFLWNGGYPMTLSLTDKRRGRTLRMTAPRPDFVFGTAGVAATQGTCRTEHVAGTSVRPAYLKTVVACRLGGLEVRREYRIYDDCPVVACDTWLRGSLRPVSQEAVSEAADRRNIESERDMRTANGEAVLDRVSLAGKHWHLRAVEFRDVTDWNNNLVEEREAISYRRTGYRGNLLFLRDGATGDGLFLLKEAPSSGSQLAYRGQDFTAEFGDVSVTGPGVEPRDIRPDRWTRIYGSAVGVCCGGELETLMALRSYQKRLRRLLPGRDETVMMNTWGDRSQDARVDERFCLAELERAARLGITHFQIDDGWQTGKSPNSAVAKGSFSDIWARGDYWRPDTVKYPRGLAPVVERGRKLGIEVGLWFNPSVQDDFADWRRDAATIVGLYRRYGIRIFKIDGLSIPTRDAEVNLRQLFDEVLARTGDSVTFNLDATAGRRGGYHLFNEYGNVFLENRYTDWGNYYPYWTLRNLWQLSRYVPAERLQIEFLNKWRNGANYAGDPFAPEGYSFEYLFATTMAGQPLAWMEASNLPEEAFALGRTVRRYREIRHDFHNGTILPVGDEPSGRSWTGFQSLCGDREGFLLVFRERTDEARTRLATWLPEGARVICEPLFGRGRRFSARVGRNGTLPVALDRQNDFEMYHYEIKD